MIDPFRIALLAFVLMACVCVPAQTRVARPTVAITDGAPAVAGRVNPLIIQIQNALPGFRLSVVAGGTTTYITAFRPFSGGYLIGVSVPPSQQPFSATLVISNPNGLSGSADFRVVPYVLPMPQLPVAPRVSAGEPSTVTIPGKNFEEGIRVFSGPTEQKATLTAGGLRVDLMLPPAQRMPYVTQLTIINPCGLRSNPCGLRSTIQVQVMAAQPTITKLEGEVTAGLDSTLTIRGSKFQPGLRVFVRIPPQQDLELTMQVRQVAEGQLVLPLKMPPTPAPPYEAKLMVMNQNTDTSGLRRQGPFAVQTFEVLAPRLQPVIDKIDPVLGAVGKPTKLTVTGRNFQKNLQVFVKVGGKETEVTKTTSYVDQSKITVEIPMSSDFAAPLTATLRIANPGGLSTTRDFSLAAK